MKRTLKIILILLIPFWTQGQNSTNFQLKTGISYQFGQPIHRLGLEIGGVLFSKSWQVQSMHHFLYCFRNYGPKIKRWETQSSLGAKIGFGNNRNAQLSSALMDEASNYSNRQYAIGYGMKYYWDEIETKQRTGFIDLSLGDFFLYTENDGLAFSFWDRYRTGSITVGYNFSRYEASILNPLNQRLALNILLYTGSTQQPNCKRISDSTYPGRYGYKDLGKAKYGDCSHGILSLRYTAQLWNRQNAFAEIGIDNEYIRHLIQNKIIHDLPFFPKQWNKAKNPHIPMLNTNNAAYRFKKNETVRKGKLIWGVGLNPPLNY